MSQTIGILRVGITATGVPLGPTHRIKAELLDPATVRAAARTQIPGVVALLKLRPDGWLELENVRQVFQPGDSDCVSQSSCEQ